MTGDPTGKIECNAYDHSQQFNLGQGTMHVYSPAASQQPVMVSLAVPISRRDPRYPLRGRTQMLRVLEHALANPQEHSSGVHVLHGVEGSGKSSIALELAARVAAHGVEVWWVRADLMVACMRALARRIGVSPADATTEDCADLLWNRLRRRSEPWLLIIDGADDLEVLTLGHAPVWEGTGWVRPDVGNAGIIVVTTRDGRPSLWKSVARLYSVDPLKGADAAQLLIDRAGGTAGSHTEAARLARLLNGLPSMLSLVGADLAELREKPTKFGGVKSAATSAGTFADYRQKLPEHLARLRHVEAGHRIPDNIWKITQWQWAPFIDQMTQEGVRHAGTLLRLLAHFDDAPIPCGMLLDAAVLSDHPLLGGDIDEEHVWCALLGFAQHGLCDLDQDTQFGVLTVHPLLRDAVLRLDRGRDDQTFHVLAARLAAAALPGPHALTPEDPGNWSLLQAIAPHVLYLHRVLSVGGTEPSTLHLLADAARTALRFSAAQGKYREAVQGFREVLEVQRRALGAEHPDTLLTWRLTAETSGGLGRFEDAEKELRQVFAAQSKVLGADHPETLTTRYVIADVLDRQGRHEEAEREFREIREIREALTMQGRFSGEAHPKILAGWSGLAWAVLSQERYEESEREFRAVLAVRKRVLGPEHPDTLRARAGLAVAGLRQGRHDESEREFLDILGIQSRLLNDDHPDTLATRNMFGGALYSQERWQEAEEVFRATWELCGRTLGDDHPMTLTSRSDLGHALYSQERWQEAEVVYRATWELRNRALGDDHADTLATRNMLGDALYSQERWQEAEEVFRATWELRSCALGDDHADTLATRNMLGDALYSQERWQEAEVVYRATWELRNRALGDDHADTLTSRNDLGHALYSQERWQEAEEVFRATWELRNRALGDDHADTLATRNMLGDALYSQERWQEAEVVYRATWELRSRALGDGHADTLTSRNDLGVALYWQERWQEAEEVFRATWELRSRALGDDHPDTLNTRVNLANALRRLGRKAEAGQLDGSGS
ncbi:tetratricopeptide repeat protein [Microbispora sp. NBC_01189]|uniref:tetratricopeptide repeat protein n=1 Tax=Microbispora sp. NBC_01189 TaxID=2903583 RepID=UPI002E1498A8|nr:tetratricopeptide repeat protein [Microbispora sp. NBC_01189]